MVAGVRTWLTVVMVPLMLASAAAGTTYVWTGGGGADASWSNASNWGGNGPADNETGVELVFPPLTGPYPSTNNLTGLGVVSLLVTTQLGDGSYSFSGNAISLQGVTTLSSPGSGNPNLVWQIPISLAGDTTVVTSGRQTQLQGPIALGLSTLTLDTEGDVLLSGTVGGSGNLVKQNSSALTITGANTYTGTTTSELGALYVGNAAALGSAETGTTINGGFLGFVPGSNFVFAEPVIFNGGKLLAYGTPTLVGDLTLNVTTDLQAFDAPAVLAISGSVIGPAGVRATGAGRVILNASSEAYEGGTEVDGVLELNTLVQSAQPVIVKGAATLHGMGTITGAIQVESGGTLAPGSSPGVLSSSGLTMVEGATLAMELDGPQPATQYDTLGVNGPVSLGGATLSVMLGYAPAGGQSFTLISQQQSGAVQGTFAGLAEGATFQVGGTTFGITYHGGDGNDVVIVAGGVPTPTSTATGTETAVPTRTASGPTASATASQTPTGAMPTATPSGAATATSAATASSAATPSPTPTAAGQCAGDCDGNGTITVNELVTGVTIALGNAPASACPRFDTDHDERVTIPELIAAVNNALDGCS